MYILSIFELYLFKFGAVLLSDKPLFVQFVQCQYVVFNFQTVESAGTIHENESVHGLNFKRNETYSKVSLNQLTKCKIDLLEAS